ncbi:MAG: hypothetical protein ACP5OV_06465 [Acidimicrobiales bacterium]
MRHTPLSRRRLVPASLLAMLVILGGLTAWLSTRSPLAASPGPEGVPVQSVPALAPAGAASGAPIDGITCRGIGNETVTYHVHTMVTLYVDGQPERLPAGIGITAPAATSGSGASTFVDVGNHDCLYWLHTHANDGIVHIEAPRRATFTLGELFAIWGQPLSATRVGPARGPVVVFVNGHRQAGSPGATVLVPQGVVQIDVGQPVVAFHPVTFHVTGVCGDGTNGCAAPTKG